MDVWRLLLDVVLLLGASLIVGGVFSRFGQNPLVGYLLVGMLLGGPTGLGVVSSEREIETVAELGVSLLLFGLGLEFSWRRLRSLGAGVLLAGSLQVVVTLLLGAVIAWAVGRTPTEATAIGALVALSSTACVLRLLVDRGELDARHGRQALGILLVQDVAVVPLALLLSVLGGSGDAASVAVRVGEVLAWAAGLVLVLFVVLNVVAVRVLGTLTLERNRELTVLLATVAGLGSAWAAHEVGVSPALGAFVAGMFLGGSSFATQIRADVAPLRVVLLTLFFGSAGMVADLRWIASHWGLVLGTAAAVVVLKTIVVWGALRLVGRSHDAAIATGICLGQLGEFSFVLAGIARANGAIPESTQLLVVSTTIVTLFVTPLLVAGATPVARALSRLVPSPRPSSDAEGVANAPPDVVVVGFGPAGRTAIEPLLGSGLRVLVLDLNVASVHEARASGLDAEVGDGTRFEVLEHAGVAEASLVLVTIPTRSPALVVVDHVRRLSPTADVVVRARHQRDVHEFAAHGAHAVFDDEEEVGRRLGRHLVETLGEGLEKAAPGGSRNESVRPG